MLRGGRPVGTNATTPATEEQHETVLETRGLRKVFKDVVAVKGLDLSLRTGEGYGFRGPRGGADGPRLPPRERRVRGEPHRAADAGVLRGGEGRAAGVRAPRAGAGGPRGRGGQEGREVLEGDEAAPGRRAGVPRGAAPPDPRRADERAGPDQDAPRPGDDPRGERERRDGVLLVPHPLGGPG